MIKPTLTALVLGLALSACASHDTYQPYPKILKNYLVSKIGPKGDPAAQKRAVEALSRDQITAGQTAPMILVYVETSQAYAGVSRIAENAGYSTYMASDRKSLTFTKGLLTASRGLGGDLFALETASTLAALKSRPRGPVQTIRIHHYMTEENHDLAVTYMCQLTEKGLQSLTRFSKSLRLRGYDETCVKADDPAITYQNSYWIAPQTGIIWHSRQWISPASGYLVFDVMIPERS